MTPAYRIAGRDTDRSAFYAAACDPRRSVVVEACAGAGKTWMLVSRIVRALLEGAQPQEILAITFTRKAAGEMRTRLADWLREFAECGEEERVQALIDRGLGPAQAPNAAPALALLHECLQDSGRTVEIRTFHAWFAQLLRAAPLDLLNQLGLQPGMALVEDLDDLRPELFRRFHARVLAEPALTEAFHALVAVRGRASVRRWLEAAWDKRVEIELADAAGVLDASVPPASNPEPAAAVREPAFVAGALALARALAATHRVRPLDAARGIEAALAQADHRAAFDALVGVLFTAAGKPRKLGDSAGLAAFIEALKQVREQLAQQEAHQEHGRMVALARGLLAEYAGLKRQRALVDMADLERVALALLADSTLAGWVQERLDARLRHVLIDEFQDTSPLQWQALQAWLSGYAGAGGGRAAPSVFIVGDPKQSIYRFRRAEPRVFAAAREFITEGLGGAVLECDHTRRNAGAVIAAVNAVFGEAAGEGAFTGWRAHTTEVGAEVRGEVRLLPSAERPPRQKLRQAADLVWRDSLTTPRHEPETVLREAEAAQVAAAVHDLIAAQGFAPADIFVLSRKRQSLRLAAAALQAVHVPYAAPEETELALLPEVRDLVALLDVLASPGHDLSLAQALKSPVFEAGDADLLTLSEAAGHAGGWWAALMAIGAGASPALGRARRLLAGWSEAAQTLPPHDLLDRIVHEGEVLARLAAVVPAERRADALEAVAALLAQALELDGARYATPYNFVRALRQRALKRAPAVRADAVQLLTVHGAKGLEARAVFVMDAQPEPQAVEYATLLTDWPVEAARPLRVAFVASEGRCPPSLVGLLDAERAARAREELNGLYVAMTRARARLVFSRTPPSRAAPARSWWDRVAPHASAWVPPLPGASGADATMASVPVLPALDRPPRAGRPAPSLDTPASLLGQAVHRMLEWASGSAPAPRADLAAAACAEQGLPAGQATAVERLASQVLDSPACAAFFHGPGLRWAGNEVPLADAGEVLRADRLVALDGPDGPVWWVLDYKLSSGPAEIAAYREQLARYRRIVQLLQPGATVRAAFITSAGELVEPEPPCI